MYSFSETNLTPSPIDDQPGRWYFFRSQKFAVAGLIFIVALSICSFLGDVLTGYDPNEHGDLITSRYLVPSENHFLGTDKFGRDIFSRVLYGGRISLTIGISVTLLSVSIGLFYGIIAGYSGRIIDAVMMRLLDFLLAFPIIFLIIPAVAIFQMQHWYLIPLLGFTGWMEIARVVRAETLSLKERDFITAAVGLGFSRTRILLRHIVPNCLTPVLVIIPLKVAETILLESGLSFLGIGVQPPTPSWGSIINDGRDVLLHAWWISTFPGIFLALTVLSFNAIGEGLRKNLARRK